MNENVDSKGSKVKMFGIGCNKNNGNLKELL